MKSRIDNTQRETGRRKRPPGAGSQATPTPSRSGGQTARALGAVAASLGNQTVARLYREQVRNTRTRSYQLGAPRKLARVEVLDTLLGIELKIGRRRLLCPDRATARFLAVFARLGVDEVAVPYDITQVARLSGVFELAMEQMLATLESATAGMNTRMKSRIRNVFIGGQRDEINQAGAGPAIPVFDQSTRQRSRR